METGALSLALNAASTGFGLEPASFMEDGTATAVAPSPVPATTAGGQKPKVKMSQVTDQGAFQEVEVAQNMLAEGDAPLGREA